MASINFYGHHEEKLSARLATHKDKEGKLSHWIELEYGAEKFVLWPSSATSIDGLIVGLKDIANKCESDLDKARDEAAKPTEPATPESAGKSAFDQWCEICG